MSGCTFVTFSKNQMFLNRFDMENNKFNDEDLIDRNEAMALLRCGSVTFWNYTREKKFPVYRAGRRMLFKKSEILESIRIPAERKAG